MFPLVLLLGFALFPLDVKIVRYALPLAGLGLAVAVYHLLLQHGVIPEPLRPCTQGVPCTERGVE
jgi:disulfide bond formation protein DsbB